MLYRGLWKAIASSPRFSARPSMNLCGPLANARRCLVTEKENSTYTCDIRAEPLSRYRPGGYHPVHLGDLFHNGRYKILNKVGWGGYSTVWTARDLMEDRFVAVKVAASKNSNNHEANMLRTISMLPLEHPGRAHLVQMLDHFSIVGPNGSHDCLVLEPLGPNLLDVLNSFLCFDGLQGTLLKAAIHQILLGMDFLARNEIGHGDLHSKNMAFSIPSLDSLDEQQFLNMFGEPETALINRKDGTMLGNNVPSYLVRPVSFSNDCYNKLNSFPMIKFIDFGQSFFGDKAPATLRTPLKIRAPEVIFGDQLDHLVDLWSLSCLLFEIIAGEPVFDLRKRDTITLVSQITDLATDKLPDRWEKKWSTMRGSTEIEGGSYTLQDWLEEFESDIDSGTGYTSQDLAKIGEFIRRTMKFEPSSRARAIDILSDPWFGDLRSEQSPHSSS